MKGKILLVAILILLLATFLRFHNLDAQSLWNDEGNSARLSERSFQLIIEGTASDIHPPLYYLLLRGWQELVGDSEFGLRSLSAFAGLVVVAGTLALGKNAFQRRLVLSNAEVDAEMQRDERFVWTAVLLSALITAVSPPLIYYSQEARMYTLLALEATLSTLFLLLWWQSINRQSKIVNRQSILLAMGYVVFATAGLYTQYAFPAVIVAQNVMLLMLMIKDSRLENGLQSSIVNLKSSIFSWVAMMLAVFLLYLPWLPIFLGNIGGGPAKRPFLPDYLLAVFRWLAFGHTVEAEAVQGPLAAVFILMGLGIFLDRGWRTAVWLAALLIPILAAYYVGAFEPQLFKILLMVIAPFAIMMVLVVFASSPRLVPSNEQSASSFGKLRTSSAKSVENYFFFGKWRLQYLGLLVFMGLLASFGVVQSLANLYTNPDYARADYRSMVTRITTDNHPNAGIILNAPNQWEVFTYYHTEGAPVYPLPRAGMSQEKVLEELNDIVAQHDRIYVIYWGDGQQDPQRVLESWLDKNTYKATSDWNQDVRFVMYAVPSAPATEIAVPVNQTIGDHISLQGYTLANDELAPGDIVQITLFWQTDTKLDQRYKVFLHLLNENGQLVTQRDSEPGSTLKPTNNWEPDERITDNHGVLIPADLPPGSYTLTLGLYDIEDPNTRLPIQTENGFLDALLLETITISE